MGKASCDIEGWQIVDPFGYNAYVTGLLCYAAGGQMRP
jgi:hypothetical protein